MIITKALITDVSEVVALVNSAYRGETSKQGWTSESHLLEGIRIDEAELTSYFAHPEVTMLKYTNEANEIIGFVYLEKTKNNKLYLGMLTVKPTLQAGGIGRQLLEAATAFAREIGCTVIKISVITSRHELIAWYQRRGFVATGQTMPLATHNSVAKQPVELMIMEEQVV
ncbi:GNAT family N-acetyltransferase [Mucilaginibacter sp. Bleaf8]|uniref:GNAT family N-acetyltransferase n=1 Tax=Mucilaginibacter sp. Bleaf8 TaxID=2834430 RepID=UPI001BD00827|nr:GNAT family N-acetyltransferase [Mucilaginibacter sp. Bleaf8]MBS7564547.1 GNAT family N-acetyltransferase [Mucilaginibacter sp. Bleaf8]